jgi:hypothetical protein
MGYKLLGFVVWKGAKWYVGRRFGDAPRKVALGGLLVAALATLLFIQRRASA